MDIWEFQSHLSGRLLMLNAVNISIGELLIRKKGFWRAVGIQAIAWSIINIGIAVGGRLVANKRMDTLENPFDDEVMKKETRNLRRILWINTGLDVLYILGGFRYAVKNVKNSTKHGTGWGIVLQGMLLFAFDLVHAKLLDDD